MTPNPIFAVLKGVIKAPELIGRGAVNLGRDIANLSEFVKQNLKTKKGFRLNTEESTVPGRRILTITGIKLDGDNGPYDIRIEVPDDICMGEIDSVLDWGNLEATKFKIIDIINKKRKLYEDEDEDNEEYARVLYFLNNINFSMDRSDGVEPDTKINKGFMYKKLYNDEGIPDAENEKQEAMVRFFAETSDPVIIENFYKKREQILQNKKGQLDKELDQEDKKEQEELKLLKKAKSLRRKIIIGVVIAAVAVIAVVAIAAVLGGPVVGAFVFSGIVQPVTYFIGKAVGFFTKFVASHPFLAAFGAVGIFAAKKTYDGFEKRTREIHQEKIQTKKALAKDVDDKIQNLNEEKKSLDSVLGLSKAKDEYDLILDGLAATKTACQYLCCHLQEYKPESKPEGYIYEVNKLNVTIKDPNSAKEFLETLRRHDGGNINKLNIQKITLCPLSEEITKIISDMLQNNTTIVDIDFKDSLGNKNNKNSANIKSVLKKGGNDTINKELIINRYLQNTTNNAIDIENADEKLIQDAINKHGKDNLSSIFGVDKRLNEQNFKENLLLSIRKAAEIKLIKQVDLRDIKIRQDMQYLSTLDKKLMEEVSGPISIYYLPKTVEGSGVKKHLNDAAKALIDVYANINKSAKVNERNALLERFSGFVKELGVNRFYTYENQGEMEAKHNKVKKDIISSMATKNTFLKLLDNGFDQFKLFLGNFVDNFKDNPDFDKKIKFIFELAKKNRSNINEAQLELFIKSIFNDKKLVDVFCDIKKEHPKIEGMEAAFQTVATKDDMADFTAKTHWLPFLEQFNLANEKNKKALVEKLIESCGFDSANKDMQNNLLDSLSKLKPEDKNHILNAIIFLGNKKESNSDIKNTTLKMLLKIMESFEMFKAVAAIKENLRLTVILLRSGVQVLDNEYFKDLIKVFFIDNLKDHKAVTAIENIFKEIKIELEKQNKPLCQQIQENFNNLHKSNVVIENAKSDVLEVKQ